jgi:hypothetical protein
MLIENNFGFHMEGLSGWKTDSDLDLDDGIGNG